MATNIHVTVMPKNPKGKEVPCDIHISPKDFDVNGVIWLSPKEDYNITFNLPGTAPHSWDQGNAFCNQKGLDCPAVDLGTQYGFSITSKAAKSITVFVPKQIVRSFQLYRMNFEDDYYCDPIIVVGDV